MRIFPRFYDAPGGAVPLPDPEEHLVGDHAVLPITMRDERVFFQHNWGPRWGDNGVGSFAIDYLDRYQREAWSIRHAVPGPRPEGVPGSADLGPSSERWDRLREHPWDGNGDSGFILLHHGTRLDILGRWLTGVSDGSVWLQCIAVMREAEGGPMIVGWMHLRGTASGVDVEELYVWPPYPRTQHWHRSRGPGVALWCHDRMAGGATDLARVGSGRHRPAKVQVEAASSAVVERAARGAKTRWGDGYSGHTCGAAHASGWLAGS